MNSREKALNLIGMAYRARKIVNGYDSGLRTITSGKAKCVIVSADASSKTIETFNKKCHFYNVPMYVLFNTEEISKAIGRGLVKIVVLTDDGFYKSLSKLLCEV